MGTLAILTIGAAALMFEDEGISTGPAQASAPGSALLTGRASVIDGDTIEIHGRRIRLYGIDAPEAGQSCQDAAGASYRCGQRAALVLANKIGQAPIACEPKDVDQYRRTVAVCRADATDLNGWMVAEGQAVAYRQFSTAYVPAEDAARAAKRGIWAGSFTMPANWRRR